MMMTTTTTSNNDSVVISLMGRVEDEMPMAMGINNGRREEYRVNDEEEGARFLPKYTTFV